MDKVSYALGMSIGRQLEQMSATELNIDDFSQAIKDVFAGSTHLTDSEAEITVQSFFQQKAEEQAKAAKAEGENFLAENAKKPGVVTLPSGLQYQVLREGNGTEQSYIDTMRMTGTTGILLAMLLGTVLAAALSAFVGGRMQKTKYFIKKHFFYKIKQDNGDLR